MRYYSSWSAKVRVCYSVRRSGCFLAKRSMSSSVSIGGLESLRNSSKSSGFGF